MDTSEYLIMEIEIIYIPPLPQRTKQGHYPLILVYEVNSHQIKFLSKCPGETQ